MRTKHRETRQYQAVAGLVNAAIEAHNAEAIMPALEFLSDPGLIDSVLDHFVNHGYKRLDLDKFDAGWILKLAVAGASPKAVQKAMMVLIDRCGDDDERLQHLEEKLQDLAPYISAAGRANAVQRYIEAYAGDEWTPANKAWVLATVKCGIAKSAFPKVVKTAIEHNLGRLASDIARYRECDGHNRGCLTEVEKKLLQRKRADRRNVNVAASNQTGSLAEEASPDVSDESPNDDNAGPGDRRGEGAESDGSHAQALDQQNDDDDDDLLAGFPVAQVNGDADPLSGKID